jgi:hypothetical protein
MKLEIALCREVEISAKAAEVSNFIQAEHSHSEIANYLSTNFYDDFFEVCTASHSYMLAVHRLTIYPHFGQVEDLRCWSGVLEKLDEILVRNLSSIPSCDNLSAEGDSGSRTTVCSVLHFLSLLLKAASDKRFFFSVEVCHLGRCDRRCHFFLSLHVYFLLNSLSGA